MESIPETIQFILVLTNILEIVDDSNIANGHFHISAKYNSRSFFSPIHSSIKKKKNDPC